jgi:hypothetical protein
MSQANLIALIAVIISPAAALAGVWLSARLTRQARIEEQQDRARQDALAGLSPFAALVVDANPDLVLHGQLREYSSPQEAVPGLYQRWLAAREPLILLWVSHPSDRVRELAFSVQAELEMLLRLMEHGDHTGLLQDKYAELGSKVLELGQSLSPLAGHSQAVPGPTSAHAPLNKLSELLRRVSRNRQGRLPD